MLLSNFGEPLDNVQVRWELTDGAEVLVQGEDKVTAERGEIVSAGKCTLSPGTTWTNPRKLLLSSQIGREENVTRNAWPVWIFPVRGNRDKAIYAYSEWDSEAFTQLVGPGTVMVQHAADGSGWSTADSQPVEFRQRDATVLVTDSLGAPVVDALMEGARVIYLADSRHTYLPTSFAPFWRETAIWLPTGHPVLGDFPHEGFVDWQFYDMTQRQVFDTGEFRSEIHPLIWGVNCRYSEQRLIADYVFETRVGKGRLLASCLNIAGTDNVAGRYMLDCFVDYAASKQFLNATAPHEGRLLESIRHPGS
jgi:hypothetical protein